jgi:hypothetical protein
MLLDSSDAQSGNRFTLRKMPMKKRHYIKKYKKSFQKTLAVFLTLLFILSIAYSAYARGGRGGGSRGGRGSVRHHRVANHGQDRDRNEQRQRQRRHNRRHNNGSVHHSTSYNHDDDYNKTSCNEYGRNCVYDYYYERCDCD